MSMFTQGMQQRVGMGKETNSGCMGIARKAHVTNDTQGGCQACRKEDLILWE
jgi:hypothetical protein